MLREGSYLENSVTMLKTEISEKQKENDWWIGEASRKEISDWTYKKQACGGRGGHPHLHLSRWHPMNDEYLLAHEIAEYQGKLEE